MATCKIDLQELNNDPCVAINFFLEQQTDAIEIRARCNSDTYLVVKKLLIRHINMDRQ